jgi:hypothetical protein
MRTIGISRKLYDELKDDLLTRNSLMSRIKFYVNPLVVRSEISASGVLTNKLLH